MSTHDAATIAGINKRIAEYEGWTEIETLPGGRQVGVAPDCGMQIGIPRYWHSADAILPVVERLCRERNLSMAIEFAQLFPASEGERFWVIFGEYNPGGREWKGWNNSLPAAACLAVVAVLDGSGNERAGA